MGSMFLNCCEPRVALKVSVLDRLPHQDWCSVHQNPPATNHVHGDTCSSFVWYKTGLMEQVACCQHNGGA